MFFLSFVAISTGNKQLQIVGRINLFYIETRKLHTPLTKELSLFAIQELFKAGMTIQTITILI